MKMLIQCQGNTMWISSAKLLNCQLGKLLKRITKDFKLNIGDRIQDENRDLIIIDRDRIPDIKNKEKLYKKYKYKCLKCGFDCGEHYIGGIYKKENWTKEHMMIHGVRCICCTKEVTVVGINDISTTDPWMIEYFIGGIEEAKQYNANSNKKIYIKCPYCGQKSNRKVKIQDIKKENGFCSCGDGYPYPEKYFYDFLKQLNIEFRYHPNKIELPWCNKYQYDFYIPAKDMIIETHGKQHYENTGGFYQISHQKIHDTDIKKKELALLNNIKYYIELDCRLSNSEWIKNSILQNDILSSLIGDNQIDWDRCANYAKRSKEKEIIDYINMYQWAKVANISEYFQVSKSYITKIVHMAIQENKIDKEKYIKHKKEMRINKYNLKQC